ncbi:hypothetical protein D3C85_1324450 [compost metagenome]
MARAAHDLAAGVLHKARGIAFQRFAEHVIGGDEVPGLAAAFHHAFDHRVCQRISIRRPLGAEVAALLAAEVAGKAAADQGGPAFLARDALRGQAGRACAAVNHRHQALRVEPAAHQGGGDVGLVLVVRADDLDGLAGHLAAKVLDGHAHGHFGAQAAQVRVNAGTVVGYAQPHDVGLGLGRAGGQGGGQGRQHGFDTHLSVSQPVRGRIIEFCG